MIAELDGRNVSRTDVPLGAGSAVERNQDGDDARELRSFLCAGSPVRDPPVGSASKLALPTVGPGRKSSGLRRPLL